MTLAFTILAAVAWLAGFTFLATGRFVGAAVIAMVFATGAILALTDFGSS